MKHLRMNVSKVSTVRSVVSIIAKMYDDKDYSPIDSIEVKQELHLQTRRSSSRRHPGWAQRIEEDTIERVGGQDVIRQKSNTQVIRMALADIAMCYIVFEDGLQLSEVAGLIWMDIDFDAQTVVLKQISSNERIIFPLSKNTISALREFRPNEVQSDSPVFPSRHTQRGGREGAYPLSVVQLSLRVSRAAVKSGFIIKK